MSELRQLDLDVAEQVMGFDRLNARTDPVNRDGEPQYFMDYPHGHDFAPFYSRDINAAFQVVEKLRADGWMVDMTAEDESPTWRVEFDIRIGGQIHLAEAESDSLPEAICRAALESVKEKAKAASG